MILLSVEAADCESVGFVYKQSLCPCSMLQSVMLYALPSEYSDDMALFFAELSNGKTLTSTEVSDQESSRLLPGSALEKVLYCLENL